MRVAMVAAAKDQNFAWPKRINDRSHYGCSRLLMLSCRAPSAIDNQTTSPVDCASRPDCQPLSRPGWPPCAGLSCAPRHCV